MSDRKLTVIQILPALEAGGVERGVVELGRYLVQQGHRSIVISAGGRMLPQLLADGSEHYPWNVGAKSLLTLRWIIRLRRLFLKIKPDVVHLRSRLPAWMAYLAWKSLRPEHRPHLVTTAHGRYSVNKYSAVMMRGERVIAISEMIRDYVITNYPRVDANAIRLIYRGVDTSCYFPEYKPAQPWLSDWYAQYPFLKNQYVLCFPARITRSKGHEHFINLMARLRDLGLPVHGVIVGEPHETKRQFMDELIGKVQAMQLQSTVTFTGHRTDLREIMAVSDVVLSLALQPEAFGRTIVEALSLNIPVVAYDHGGVSEQMRELYPEGLVSVGDVDAAVQKLVDWRHNKPRVRPNTEFTLGKMLASTVSVYQELNH